MKLLQILVFSTLLLTNCGEQDPDILLKSGNLYFEQGNTEKAMEIYTEIGEAFPKYKKSFFNKGIIESQALQWDLAIDDFSRAIEIDPMYSHAYLMRGRAYLAKSQFSNAENDFKVAQFGDYKYSAMTELARLCIKKQEFTEALKYTNSCLTINDTSVYQRETKASILLQLGENIKSIRLCNALLSEQNKNWHALLIKSKNRLELRALDSIYNDLMLARQLSNDNFEVLSTISEYYLLLQEGAMAVAFAEKGLQQKPESVPLILNKARGFDAMGRFETANEIYLSIGEVADSIPEFHFYLSKNYAAIGDTANAIVEVSDAISRRTDYKQAYQLRSALKAKMGDLEGAISDREKAIKQ